MANSLMGSEKIINAAESLARLVKHSPHHSVAFDMNVYMQVVLGIRKPQKAFEFLEQMQKQPELTEEQVAKAQIDGMKLLGKDLQKGRTITKQFMDALTYAFSYESVRNICDCVVTDLGEYEEFGFLEDAWVVMVLKRPAATETVILDL